jgi:hypothetical protein
MSSDKRHVSAKLFICTNFDFAFDFDSNFTFIHSKTIYREEGSQADAEEMKKLLETVGQRCSRIERDML